MLRSDGRITTKTYKNSSFFRFPFKKQLTNENVNIMDKDSSSKTLPHKNQPIHQVNPTKTRKIINNNDLIFTQGRKNRLPSIENKEGQISALKERLKNLHYFYKARIEEERNKNLQRNQLFLSVIEELERRHFGKIQFFQKTLGQATYECKDIEEVDKRVGVLIDAFDQIVSKQRELKMNAELGQKLLRKKKKSFQEKQRRLMRLRGEILEERRVVENFELEKLKQNRRMKIMISLIDGNI